MKKINLFIEICMFLISPLFTLPVLFADMYRGRFGNKLFLISLIMAMVAIITPPFADSYRHTLQYIFYSQDSLNSDVFFQTNGKDFIFYTLSHWFAVNNIPFEYIKAIFVFICYQISFIMFKEIVCNNEFLKVDKKYLFYLFLIFFLSVPFVWIVNGIRMATAGYIIVLAWLYIYKNKFAKGVIFYIIALSLHFSSILFLPIILLTKFQCVKISRRSFIIFSLVCFIISEIAFYILPASVIQFLGMEDTFEYYVVNSQENFSSVMSVNGLIAMILERSPLIVIAYYLLFTSLKNDRNTQSLIFLIYLIIILFMPFTILFQKFCLMVIPIVLYLHIDKLMVKKSSLKILSISCLILAFAYIYGYREVFLSTPFYQLIVSPFYTLYNLDTFENINNAIL